MKLYLIAGIAAIVLSAVSSMLSFLLWHSLLSAVRMGSVGVIIFPMIISLIFPPAVCLTWLACKALSRKSAVFLWIFVLVSSSFLSTAIGLRMVHITKRTVPHESEPEMQAFLRSELSSIAAIRWNDYWKCYKMTDDSTMWWFCSWSICFSVFSAAWVSGKEKSKQAILSTSSRNEVQPLDDSSQLHLKK